MLLLLAHFLVLLAPPDTLQLPGGVVRVLATDRNEFENAPRPRLINSLRRDFSERKQFADEDKRVVRKGNKLILHPSDGPVVTLTTGIASGDDVMDDTHYVFLKALPQIHQWLIEGGTNDYVFYCLIDQKTGKQHELPGYPIFSPSNQQFACAMRLGRSEGGLEVWQLNAQQEPVLQWRRTGWEIRAVRWADEQNLLLAYPFYVGYQEKTAYARLQLPR